MNKKTLVITLLTFVMLTTPLIGAVPLGFGGNDKTVATFTWDVHQWPLDLAGTGEGTKSRFTQKGDWIMQNVYTYGEGPPLEEVEFIYVASLGTVVTNPTYGQYALGGIRLTIDDGTNEYVLTGDFSKTELVFMLPNKKDPAKSGILEVSKWNFTITAVEEVITGVAPVDAVDSTMSGTLRGHDSEAKIIGNKGTGCFEGAVLRGTQTLQAGGIPNPTPPPLYALFSWAEGEGEIVFP
jgi:hypothetical protein